jgi:Icc-related predicted phosphoesterase/uncharacterized protein YprB with RNaseH-like and TPR domain
MTTASPESAGLRLFFFSDWRLQPLELVDALLEAAGPIDLVLYGGDDVCRFAPPPPIPDAVVSHVVEQRLWVSIPTTSTLHHILAGDVHCVPQHDLADIEIRDPDQVIAIAADVLGRPPLRDLPPSRVASPRSYASLGEILELFRPQDDNRLRAMATMARFGVGAVLGNDCSSGDRSVLEVPGVRDLHTAPIAIGGWGFVGIEGAICRRRADGRLINGIGYTLHPEHEVVPHLARSLERLQVPPQRLVIVSHTPPAECRLDLGIRFGFDWLGSPALTSFVREHEPALVVCGHCHSRGGRSARLGKTLVVNGASDDQNARRTRAAVIELAPDQAPVLTWIDPTPHSVVFVPGVGPATAAKLASAGVTRPDQLFAADETVLKGAGFGEVRRRKIEAYRRAVAENRPVWLSGASVALPAHLLFYDVETGLNVGEMDGPWMIGALAPGAERVEQWVAPDEDRGSRRQMFEDFLGFVRSHPTATLCSWSGTRFDEQAVDAGLERWYRKARSEWERLPQLDLLTLLKRQLILPTQDWSLKSIARWCGFPEIAAGEVDLDGFEVGLLYEEFRMQGATLPIEAIRRYNEMDVLSLAYVAQWMREHLTSTRQ